MKRNPGLKPRDAEVLRMIKEYGRLTYKDIQEELGLSRTYAHQICQRLNALKEIRICAYTRGIRGQSLPLYSVANGRPDVPHPAPLTYADRCRRFREKEAKESVNPRWNLSAYDILVKGVSR